MGVVTAVVMAVGFGLTLWHRASVNSCWMGMASRHYWAFTPPSTTAALPCAVCEVDLATHWVCMRLYAVVVVLVLLRGSAPVDIAGCEPVGKKPLPQAPPAERAAKLLDVLLPVCVAQAVRCERVSSFARVAHAVCRQVCAGGWRRCLCPYPQPQPSPVFTVCA